MNPDTLFRQPLPVLRAALEAGQLSSRALTEHFLERIDRLNSRINAFCFVDAQAGKAADASDARRRAGRALGPLDGLPVAVKDNLWVGGMPASWGAPLFRSHVPAQDETAVARLRRSGAVILGKTNCPEFAMRGITDNPLFGPTVNPWDINKTPGGSSGGAASAVAAGLVPLALATDGGGSIRRPAAHTGLVGLKPSVGRVRRGGGFAQIMFDCEVIGAIARRVADVRDLFDAVASPPAKEMIAGKLKILFVPAIGDAPVDPQIAMRCGEAAKRFESMGHSVLQGMLPFDIAPAMEAWSAMGMAGLARLARAHADFFALAAGDFAEQAHQGLTLGAAELAGEIETLLDFRVTLAALFDTVDLILTPATAAQPWPVGEAYPASIGGQDAGPRGHAVFTGWVNAAGLPAIALPAEPDSGGMPVGFQLVAAHGKDDLLLAAGEAYEAAFAFADRWPAMAL